MRDWPRELLLLTWEHTILPGRKSLTFLAGATAFYCAFKTAISNFQSLQSSQCRDYSKLLTNKSACLYHSSDVAFVGHRRPQDVDGFVVRHSRQWASVHLDQLVVRLQPPILCDKTWFRVCHWLSNKRKTWHCQKVGVLEFSPGGIIIEIRCWRYSTQVFILRTCTCFHPLWLDTRWLCSDFLLMNVTQLLHCLFSSLL